MDRKLLSPLYKKMSGLAKVTDVKENYLALAVVQNKIEETGIVQNGVDIEVCNMNMIFEGTLVHMKRW